MREIQLRKGHIAIVDDADYDVLSAHRWYLETNGYVRAKINGQMVSMHRFLMSLSRGQKIDVDHINGIRHDNRRSNLRLCTRSQNLGNQSLKRENSSGYKGVSWDKSKRKWQVKITFQGKQFHLGRYDDPEVAHQVYVREANRLFGEFANPGVQFHASPNERFS